METNNCKNCLKLILKTHLLQHRISLVYGHGFLLPVINSSVKSVQRRASSILIDGEILVSTTMEASNEFYKSPRILMALSRSRAGISSFARAMRCCDDASSMSSTIAMLNMFAWKCDLSAMGVNTAYYGELRSSHSPHRKARPPRRTRDARRAT